MPEVTERKIWLTAIGWYSRLSRRAFVCLVVPIVFGLLLFLGSSLQSLACASNWPQADTLTKLVLTAAYFAITFFSVRRLRDVGSAIPFESFLKKIGVHSTGLENFDIMITAALFGLGVGLGLPVFVGSCWELWNCPPAPTPLLWIWVVFVGGLQMTLFVLLPLIWLTRPSSPGPNRYGPNPREVTP